MDESERARREGEMLAAARFTQTAIFAELQPDERARYKRAIETERLALGLSDTRTESVFAARAARAAG